MVDDAEDVSAGERIKRHRGRAGMSRATLGGLVGRSEEWVKAVETGRIRPPRLPMLLRIAGVLGVSDLVALTGDHRLTTATYGKSAHEQLPAITGALTEYRFASDTEPVPAGELRIRLAGAWELWHGARRHRTALAVVLPGLLRDAQDAARRLDQDDRRPARAALAECYHLAQLFLSFQPVPELIVLTGDRGMQAAQDADDPCAIAVAAWYLNHVWRDAGTAAEARVEVALGACALLRPAESREDLVRWGLLQLACALSYAKLGRAGDAWRYWDGADRAATALGAGFAHPYLIFGRQMVDAYAVTMHVDLFHAGRARQAAGRLDIGAIPSTTRRAFHLIESARAASLDRDDRAVVELLTRATKAGPDTARYNLFAQGWLPELAAGRDAQVATDARAVAAELGIAV
jgi:transcriptional regulator with XRE-family HTH domain